MWFTLKVLSSFLKYKTTQVAFLYDKNTWVEVAKKQVLKKYLLLKKLPKQATEKYSGHK